MEGSRGRRKRGAGARRRSASGTPGAFPWRQVRNPYSPIEVLSEDQVEAIHEASLKVLERQGLRLLFDEAQGRGVRVEQPSDRFRARHGPVPR